jgi:hypothetical protein
MNIYIKENSKVPEFISFTGEQPKVAPDGCVIVTQEDVNKIQEAIDANPEGSIVNGKWVAKK